MSNLHAHFTLWFLFQEMFTEASSDLFVATHHRVYFRNVTILVPQVCLIHNVLLYLQLMFFK